MANRYSLLKHSKSRYFDSILIMILLIIIVFGLIMLYSVSSYDGSINYHNAAYYLEKQLKSTLFGLALMVVISILPYSLFERFSWVAYGVAAVSVALVEFFGKSVNGAKRWLYIGPVSIQPAEIAKIAVIILMAHLLSQYPQAADKFKKTAVMFIPTIILCGMILVITRNLSSAFIVFGIAFVMCMVVTKNTKMYIISILVVGLLAALYVYILVSNPGAGGGFRAERVLAWLDPNAYASGKGYQTIQALYAIGSGGLMGKGLGQSMQKLGFIPEAQNDMIFAIICEEMGFLGAICIISMFMILIWRCLIIANNTKDLFGALLVVGFMAHIAIQVFLNIAVVTNTIPNTGISLPFISYGGSSVVMLLAEVGMVLSVQRSIMIREIV